MHKGNCINFPIRTVFPSYRHVSSNSFTGSIKSSYLFRSAEGSVGVSRFHSRAASKQETVSSARFPLISTLAGQTLMKNPHSSWPSYPSPPPPSLLFSPSYSSSWSNLVSRGCSCRSWTISFLRDDVENRKVGCETSERKEPNER